MTSPPELKLLLSTLPSAEEADRIAALLVEERLAACVQSMPGLTSVYRWAGKAERSTELLLLIKSTRAAECQVRLAELHPYDLPEILELAVDGGLPAYLGWAAEECRPE